jgi:hypothetical protein
MLLMTGMLLTSAQPITSSLLLVLLVVKMRLKKASNKQWKDNSKHLSRQGEEMSVGPLSA